MSAKAYDKKTAAFAGYVIQNIPANLTDEVMDGWMNNPAAMKKFLAGLVRAEEPEQPQKLFVSASTYALHAVKGKETKRCFNSKQWCHRDGDFDRWLGPYQPDADDSSITVLTPGQDWMFRQAAVSVLGVSPDTPLVELGHLLIERGHTMTLPQAEALAETTTVAKENTGLRTYGRGNFFFVQTGDENDPVSVGDVRFGVRQWAVGVFRLGDNGRWNTAYRLLVRNLEPSKLGL